MDANNNDNYVLVLEDRTEVKNEAEVGKLSVVSNIDEKEKLKTAPAEEAALCPMICAHFLWQPLPQCPRRAYADRTN